MSTTAVPAESTTRVELVSATERVAAAKVEALEPWAGGKQGMGAECCHEKERAGLMHCEGQGQSRGAAARESWREDGWGGMNSKGLLRPRKRHGGNRLEQEKPSCTKVTSVEWH